MVIQMKIEDAKSKLARTALLMFEANGTSTLDGDATLALIDEIYADFEKEQSNLRYQLMNPRRVEQSPGARSFKQFGGI